MSENRPPTGLSAAIDDLIAERDRLRGVARAATDKAAGIDWSIDALRQRLLNEPVQITNEESVGERLKRGEAKGVLIDLLRDAGPTGLTALEIGDKAAERGTPIPRGTVASNLNRLKSGGVVVGEGDKYRLPEFSRQPSLSAISGGKSS